jgi:hypothetical protein
LLRSTEHYRTPSIEGPVDSDRRRAIDCTVRSLSETGAALEVVSPLFIPDRFTLVIHTEQLNRPCKIVWRKQNRIGIPFD